MKILLPYSNAHGRKFGDKVVVGGIEKFCHSIYETFDNVKIVEIEDDTKIKENVELIKKSAIEYDADIVISNWTKASYCGMKIMDCPVPIMKISHGNNPMMSTLYRFYKLKEFGHSVFFVSNYQSKYYKDMAKRTKSKLIDIDGYINSGYVKGNKPKIEYDTKYDCITIGRCDPNEKKPFLLKKLLKDTKMKTLVMTNRIEKGRPEYEYYERNKDTPDTLWDLEYEDVMNNLSKSMTFFQTFWQEAYGLTTLEALSRGVPVILNTRDNIHAAETIQKRYLCFWKQKHCTKIPLNDKDALIYAINSYRGIDRKEIQDMTWDKHSHDKWKSHFENCIDKTIENFKKRYPIKKYMT